ncbi:hypothetical protein BD311DRAFT_756048 [Dichomitus squalens]|uniref:Uncharacterized protein n=1 Tax=Dichomitus squalens TaxID=114155 RepID=A0A4Q9MTJ6_9APHY|nr:hypothetical protein BD311DRAFT_756048 [Dichomitus squalens]
MLGQKAGGGALLPASNDQKKGCAQGTFADGLPDSKNTTCQSMVPRGDSSFLNGDCKVSPPCCGTSPAPANRQDRVRPMCVAGSTESSNGRHHQHPY